jgi:hypothetical protein
MKLNKYFDFAIHMLFVIWFTISSLIIKIYSFILKLIDTKVKNKSYNYNPQTFLNEFLSISLRPSLKFRKHIIIHRNLFMGFFEYLVYLFTILPVFFPKYIDRDFKNSKESNLIISNEVGRTYNLPIVSMENIYGLEWFFSNTAACFLLKPNSEDLIFETHWLDKFEQKLNSNLLGVTLIFEYVKTKKLTFKSLMYKNNLFTTDDNNSEMFKIALNAVKTAAITIMTIKHGVYSHIMTTGSLELNNSIYLSPNNYLQKLLLQCEKRVGEVGVATYLFGCSPIFNQIYKLTNYTKKGYMDLVNMMYDDFNFINEFNISKFVTQFSHIEWSPLIHDCLLWWNKFEEYSSKFIDVHQTNDDKKTEILNWYTAMKKDLIMLNEDDSNNNQFELGELAACFMYNSCVYHEIHGKNLLNLLICPFNASTINRKGNKINKTISSENIHVSTILLYTAIGIYHTPLYHNINYLKNNIKAYNVTKDYLSSLHYLQNKLKLNLLEPIKLQTSTGI